MPAQTDTERATRYAQRRTEERQERRVVPKPFWVHKDDYDAAKAHIDAQVDKAREKYRPS